jgi:hypothetical protein
VASQAPTHMSNSGDMDKRPAAGSLSMAELGASLPPTSGGEFLSKPLVLGGGGVFCMI